jgi:hypothetical protein
LFHRVRRTLGLSHVHREYRACHSKFFSLIQAEEIEDTILNARSPPKSSEEEGDTAQAEWDGCSSRVGYTIYHDNERWQSWERTKTLLETHGQSFYCAHTGQLISVTPEPNRHNGVALFCVLTIDHPGQTCNFVGSRPYPGPSSQRAGLLLRWLCRSLDTAPAEVRHWYCHGSSCDSTKINNESRLDGIKASRFQRVKLSSILHLRGALYGPCGGKEGIDRAVKVRRSHDTSKEEPFADHTTRFSGNFSKATTTSMRTVSTTSGRRAPHCRKCHLPMKKHNKVECLRRQHAMYHAYSSVSHYQVTAPAVSSSSSFWSNRRFSGPIRHKPALSFRSPGRERRFRDSYGKKTNSLRKRDLDHAHDTDIDTDIDTDNGIDIDTDNGIDIDNDNGIDNDNDTDRLDNDKGSEPDAEDESGVVEGEPQPKTCTRMFTFTKQCGSRVGSVIYRFTTFTLRFVFAGLIMFITNQALIAVFLQPCAKNLTANTVVCKFPSRSRCTLPKLTKELSQDAGGASSRPIRPLNIAGVVTPSYRRNLVIASVYDC